MLIEVKLKGSHVRDPSGTIFSMEVSNPVSDIKHLAVKKHVLTLSVGSNPEH